MKQTTQMLRLLAFMVLTGVAVVSPEPGTAALVYRGVIFDRQGQPVEYLVSINHPQRVVFKLADSRVNSLHSDH